MGRLDAAQARLVEALERYRVFDDLRAISHVQYCLARAYRAEGDLTAALDHLRKALDIVDQLRDAARRGGHYYRPIWLWQEYAELEVEILLERFRVSRDPQDLARAFRATDLARARTLFERVVETNLGVRTSANPSLLTAERRLQAALNQKARQRNSATAIEPANDPIEPDIRRLRSELERVRASIRAADPRHAASSPSPVTAEQAKRLIGPDTALLSYVLGEDRSHLLILHSSGLTVRELPSRRDLEGHARTLYHALSQSRTDRMQWLLIAKRLGGLLLPKEAIPPEVKRLIVVPDGLLNYVSFAALASPRNEGRQVIDDYEITYVPSVSVLASLRNRSRGAKETELPFSQIPSSTAATSGYKPGPADRLRVEEARASVRQSRAPSLGCYRAFLAAAVRPWRSLD